MATHGKYQHQLAVTPLQEGNLRFENLFKEISVKRKPKLTPRNPLVAISMFRKAGAHGNAEKALRRKHKVSTAREANSIGRVAGFYPEGCEFDPRASHQMDSFCCARASMVQAPDC